MKGTRLFKASIVSSLPVDQQKLLYITEGWCDGDAPTDRLAAINAGSFLVAAAVTHDGTLIGMGRMISDGAGDGYIQDVVVRPDWRGCGVGAALVSLLSDEAVRRGVRWVGLVAAPGTTGFYEKLGFRAMKDHVPMLLGVDDDR